MALLTVQNMTHYFGGLQAVNGYNLSVEPGQIMGLIGPNGAGKTTIFNLLTGVHRPTQGSVVFDGRSLVGLMPHQIANLGLGRTFQDIKLWRHLSVREQVEMARYGKLTYGFWGAVLGTARRRRQERQAKAKAEELLEMLGIAHLADQPVLGLPYGAQRRVEIARALAIEPRLLLLDEPTVGMTNEELEEIMAVIRRINAELGLAIFLIEHRLKFVMELCSSVQCLVFGSVIAQSSPQEIQNDPRVIEAYLGQEDAG